MSPFFVIPHASFSARGLLSPDAPYSFFAHAHAQPSRVPRSCLFVSTVPRLYQMRFKSYKTSRFTNDASFHFRRSLIYTSKTESDDGFLDFDRLEEDASDYSQPIDDSRHSCSNDSLKNAKRDLMNLIDEATPSKAAIDIALERLAAEQADLDVTVRLLSVCGLWRVIYAPHIQYWLSSLLFTRFDKIDYWLKEGKDGFDFGSRVLFSNLFTRGSLNASGSLGPDVKQNHVQVLFTSFWVGDFDGDSDSTFDVGGPSGPQKGVGQLIDLVGRFLFIPDFSLFRVTYMDDDLAVFRFLFLNSPLVIARIDSESFS
mmetsp:Transcript_28663/g.48141  ORF Transcript_28663/g.48141 Transcript_28663/m.48141 type:complete len:314 (-) Transcript_28663:427-1368(-)